MMAKMTAACQNGSTSLVVLLTGRGIAGCEKCVVVWEENIAVSLTLAAVTLTAEEGSRASPLPPHLTSRFSQLEYDF